MKRAAIYLAIALPLACSGDGGNASNSFGTGTNSATDSATDSTTDCESGTCTGTSNSTSSTTGATDSATASTSGGVKLDVAAGDIGDTGGTPTCTVPDGDLDAIPPCETTAPAGSFEPDVQWEWNGEGLHVNSITTPLVANLTDDNSDGKIDLCDIPDVVVVTSEGVANNPGRIWVLSGDDGTVHWDQDLQIPFSVVPAIGDVDGDGLPEIVVADASNLIILGHDGQTQSSTPVSWIAPRRVALGLADLDADGDVEIYGGAGVADHTGATIWSNNEPLNFYHTTTAADLDGDGDLEVIIGRSAYHHDGSEYYMNAGLPESHPAVGDLDGDTEPEVLLSNGGGLTLLEHDGSPTLTNQTPTGDPASSNNWKRPAAIHDFDDDGGAEFAVSSANNYAVYEGNFSIVWQAPVSDLTGVAGGTAFDFLGDGSAEAMYGDESTLYIYDDAGQVLLSVPRASRTTTEYPVVADVDNDGSAEIVVVSESEYGNGTSPTVQVIRDKMDRWVPARRIWNQHTYHVTNVREDGTIPQVEPPHWDFLNTFRTQAQQENGLCNPEG